MDAGLVQGAGPLYAQVREILARRLSDGEWRPGELIPSEHQLAQQLSVSQGTVRKALNELVAMNVLVRQQGKGTFVASHDAQRALFHFFHITADDGSKQLPESRVLGWSRRRINKREATLLQLPVGSRGIRIERLRELGGQPVIVETVLLPAVLFPDLAKSDKPLPNTLYQLYQHEYGVTIHRAQEQLRAVAATQRDAELLNIEPGAPLLEIERVALTLQGKPVEVRLSRCCTSEHYYNNTLT